ncbi:uncharacterized protein B0I36DRAFT_155320 [Microdochium trichocladiopsis]|uniref:Uncharacterized protein n=1 Tax=Microdochium trichocladiopsis TaxID=1682393 RepID=A0A9P8Y2Z0_9PEZI|nr:uncharacterized protein B0I36DRAFT_155320 [Microdochium trichocladiopsis]KAH7026213.1 hypothetical protein B0I36DRAFT_155320 [Microdochium trichocladiopsis]
MCPTYSTPPSIPLIMSFRLVDRGGSAKRARRVDMRGEQAEKEAGETRFRRRPSSSTPSPTPLFLTEPLSPPFPPVVKPLSFPFSCHSAPAWATISLTSRHPRKCLRTEEWPGGDALCNRVFLEPHIKVPPPLLRGTNTQQANLPLGPFSSHNSKGKHLLSRKVPEPHVEDDSPRRRSRRGLSEAMPSSLIVSWQMTICWTRSRPRKDSL